MRRISFSAFELKPDHFYRVVKGFTDYDGVTHPVGERWRYCSRNYFPYDAGLSLNIESVSGLRTIRLQDYPEAQRDIIESFSQFVVQEEHAPL
jgi:hypothetical protein